MTNNIKEISPGRNLKIATFQAAIEKVIEDFLDSNRVAVAEAVGTLEIIKLNIMNASNDQ